MPSIEEGWHRSCSVPVTLVVIGCRSFPRKQSIHTDETLEWRSKESPRIAPPDFDKTAESPCSFPA